MVHISCLQQIISRKTFVSMHEYNKTIKSCSLLRERSKSKQQEVKIKRSTKSQLFQQTQEQQSTLSTLVNFGFKTFGATSFTIRTQTLCYVACKYHFANKQNRHLRTSTTYICTKYFLPWLQQLTLKLDQYQTQVSKFYGKWD